MKTKIIAIIKEKQPDIANVTANRIASAISAQYTSLTPAVQQAIDNALKYTATAGLVATASCVNAQPQEGQCPLCGNASNLVTVKLITSRDVAYCTTHNVVLPYPA